MQVSTAREIFESAMPAKFEKHPELATQINAIYKFVVGGDDGGTWLVDLTDAGAVREGDGDAGCTITVGGEDLVSIVNGQLNAQMAFMTGKLKVAGDMSLAMKLGSIFG